MTIDTTQQGVATENNSEALAYTRDDAAAAFLSRWTDEEDQETVSEPAEEEEAEVVEEEETTEVESEEETEEVDEETEDRQDDDEPEADEDDEESEEAPEKVLDDEAIVKVKVDGKELDVSVKDLKRLYGQEAALTRKSQEAAEKRKEIEQTSQKLNATLEKLYEKALERWKPYSEIDMLLASKQLDEESFTALRKEAQSAYEEFRFISQEADAFVQEQQAQRQQMLQETAKESVKVLKERIPNWSPQLYDQIREYAINKVGIAPDIVNNMVDPNALEVLHKARLYDESKKIVTKKKVVTPKKVLKPTVSSSSKDMKTNVTIKAAKKFSNTGSIDDAAELFMARWSDED